MSAATAWMITNQVLLASVAACTATISGVLAIIWYMLSISLKIKTEILDKHKTVEKTTVREITEIKS